MAHGTSRGDSPWQSSVESVLARSQVEGVALPHILETDGAALVLSVDAGATSRHVGNYLLVGYF